MKTINLTDSEALRVVNSDKVTLVRLLKEQPPDRWQTLDCVELGNAIFADWRNKFHLPTKQVLQEPIYGISIPIQFPEGSVFGVKDDLVSAKTIKQMAKELDIEPVDENVIIVNKMTEIKQLIIAELTVVSNGVCRISEIGFDTSMTLSFPYDKASKQSYKNQFDAKMPFEMKMFIDQWNAIHPKYPYSTEPYVEVFEAEVRRINNAN